MDNKGQTGMGIMEGMIILMLIIAVGVTFFYEITKKTDTSIFKAGSQSISPAPVVHFGGCAIVKEYIYADGTNSQTNSAK